MSVCWPVTLHITSAWHLYPGFHGNLVAMRSIYLEIWQLQMSLGAALGNKASVKLQAVRAHACSLLPRPEVLTKKVNVWRVSDDLGGFQPLPRLINL